MSRFKPQHRLPVWGLAITALLGGIFMLFFQREGAAKAVSNPPALLQVQPTVENHPYPTRTTETGKTVLLENPSAPALPSLDAPVEVQVAGITVRLEALDTRALSQGQVDAQVCFSLPSESMDWMIGDAWLETATGSWPLIQGAVLRYEKAPDGTIWRCETVTFEAPKALTGEKTTLTRLVIASLFGPHGEQPDCQAVQQALASSRIRVAPVQQGEGLGGCRVVSKPATLSQEEAEARVAELLVHQRQGPWVFDLQP